MVAWIVSALLSHSVEEYVLVLVIGGSNPAQGICLYGSVAVINNNLLQWTHYIHYA